MRPVTAAELTAALARAAHPRGGGDRRGGGPGGPEVGDADGADGQDCGGAHRADHGDSGEGPGVPGGGDGLRVDDPGGAAPPGVPPDAFPGPPDAVRDAVRAAAAVPGDHTRLRELAEALLVQARTDGRFMAALRRWLPDTADTGPVPRPSPDPPPGGPPGTGPDPGPPPGSVPGQPVPRPSPGGPPGPAAVPAPPGRAPHGDGGRTGNLIGDAARITGPVVQARDIGGGIHVHEAPAAPRPPVPRQLLPVPAHFTDRRADLERLDSLRRGGGPGRPSRPVVVSGPAGVGKTALVSRWLWDLRAEAPDGQLYADLRAGGPGGPARPSEVLSRFLRAFGAGPVPVEPAELAAMWRSLTAGLRIAVMLDNAMTAAQVRPLLPSTNGDPSGSVAVVTSRYRLTGLVTDGAAFHQLGLLPLPAAMELFSRGVGAARVEREPGASREVVTLCACLPLAVCVAAARLASRPRQPVTAMAEALARDSGRLALLSTDGETAVQTALDESYRALPADAARVYRRLGLFPGPVFGGAETAAACGLPPVVADRLLDTLVEVNLVEDIGPDPTGAERFRLHDLVRLHARQRAEGEDSGETRDEAVRRLLDWYLATATDAERLLTPSHRNLARDYAFPPAAPAGFDDEDGALAWLDAHQTDLMGAVRSAVAAGLDPTAWQLVDAMWPLFLRRRPYDLWIEAHDIGLSAARRCGARDAVSRMLTSGAGGLLNAGRPDDAIDWFARALRQAREDGDRRGQSQALHGLGQAFRLQDRLAQAGALFAQALAVREAIGHRRGAALSRLCLGDVALAADSPLEAITHLATAHRELLAEDDRYDAARALALLGRAHDAVGEHGTAERRLREALEEFRAAGSAHWQARTLEMLGQSCQDRADPAAARSFYEQSRALYGRVGADDTHRLEDRLRSLVPGNGPGAET